MKRSERLLTVVALLLLAPRAQSQTLSDAALVNALREGGHVLVMRHASSPRDAPAMPQANPDNINLERQLDDHGRTTAIAMGRALRERQIPVGDVFTSPAYRALETVRLAQFPNPRIQAELGDGGQSMQGVTDTQSAWLRKKVTELPTRTNVLLVTHQPNIDRALARWQSGLAEGETLILGSDGNGGATLVARIKIEQWPKMPF
jgi:phosphohistidine phosphatase SixA